MLVLLGQSAQPLSTTQLWAFIGLAVFALLYIAIIRPMMRKKSDPLEPAAFGSLAKQRGIERQMENLIVELHEMTRQISAQLDTRSAKLDVLIKQADQRIERLQSLTTAAIPPDPAFGTSDPMPDPRHAEIYTLADEGRDANQIAAQLDRPRGEVELILALRGKG